MSARGALRLVDESATASMVERSNGFLIATVLGQVDVVHGHTYLLLEQRTGLAASDVLALGLPNAAGAAAAGEAQRAEERALTTPQVAALGDSSTGVSFDSVQSRIAPHLYPEVFTGLRDVVLRSPGDRLDQLSDSVLPASEAAARSSDLRRLVMVSRPSEDRVVSGGALAAFREVGFRPVRTVRGCWSTVILLEGTR